jgi:hypothetical protein
MWIEAMFADEEMRRELLTMLPGIQAIEHYSCLRCGFVGYVFPGPTVGPYNRNKPTHLHEIHVAETAVLQILPDTLLPTLRT